ncbi:MAG: hypothetical protein K8S55_09490 [Phycisphaerae bacterium]|nr:hypothetical protein [Phycisphaerae bacterium]
MALNESITLEELVSNYEGCCELWKIKIAASCIIEMGVPPCDWEDLMQEIMLWVTRFRYSPQIRAFSESTVLGTRIRSRIRNWKRAFGRRFRAKQRYGDLSHPESYTVDLLRLAGENPLKTLRRAVQTMVARLDDTLRRFCWMIMNGLTLREIALALHIRWHEVRKRVPKSASSSSPWDWKPLSTGGR